MCVYVNVFTVMLPITYNCREIASPDPPSARGPGPVKTFIPPGHVLGRMIVSVTKYVIMCLILTKKLRKNISHYKMNRFS